MNLRKDIETGPRPPEEIPVGRDSLGESEIAIIGWEGADAVKERL